jgi:GMP synthase-like glutamine amidotransferase
VLVIEHEGDAPVARFGQWLSDAGVSLDVRRPAEGEPVPTELQADGVVVLGGAMSAHDDALAPWLPQTRRLLAEAVAAAVPVFAICLGAQLMAVACGGSVEVGDAGPELGICELQLTPEAAADRLFAPLTPPVIATQWHKDAITSAPPGAVVLAGSKCYDVQAFRLGESAWGVQFHPEVDGAVMADWVAAEHGDRFDTDRLAQVAREVDEAQLLLEATWRGVAGRFAALVTSHANGQALLGRRS